MNWKKVLTVGLKVVVAAGAAVAVWLGFSKAIDPSTPGPKHERKGVNSGEGSKADCKNNSNTQKGAQVVGNLRKLQDTCGKLFSVVQSLTTVGENLFRIFNGGTDFGYFPGNNRTPGGYTRVSSNVIEAQWTPGPGSAWGAQNKYCF